MINFAQLFLLLYETLRGLAGLPVRIEALEHVWFIQRCFCGAPYKLEFFSHVNVS